MIKAYFLIETKHGYDRVEVKDSVLSQYWNRGIKSVDITSGPYDLIGVYDEGNLEDLINLDLEIRKINGIDRIFSLIVLHDANT